MKIEEMLLATSKRTYVDNTSRVDTHSTKRGSVCDRGNDKLTAIFEANEAAIKEVITRDAAP